MGNFQIVNDRLPSVAPNAFIRFNVIDNGDGTCSVYLQDRANSDAVSTPGAVTATGLQIVGSAPGTVTGSGTTNQLTKWTNGPSSVLGDSSVSDSGTLLTSTAKLFLNVANPDVSQLIAGSVKGHFYSSFRLSFFNEVGVTSNISFDGTNYNLDDIAQAGAIYRINQFTPFSVAYQAAAANPVTPSTIFSVGTDGSTVVGATSGAGTSRLVIGGGSGNGLVINTPGNFGAFYPVTSNQLGVGFTGSVSSRPASPVWTVNNAGDVFSAGILSAGSGPTTLTDATGRILSAALNTVQIAQGGTGLTALGTALQQIRVNAGGTALEYFTASASGANTALSNLASVAVNASLNPGADNTIGLGTTALRYNALYLSGPAFFDFGSAGAPGIAFRDATTRGFYGAAGGIQVTIGGVNQSAFLNAELRLSSTSVASFSTGQPDTNAADIAIGRNGVGVLEVNNGTLGTFRDLITRVTRVSGGGVTVASLPSAAANQGGFAFVTDATLTAITGLGLAVTGGGTNKVPVYSDGANWIIL